MRERASTILAESKRILNINYQKLVDVQIFLLTHFFVFFFNNNYCKYFTKTIHTAHSYTSCRTFKNCCINIFNMYFVYILLYCCYCSRNKKTHRTMAHSFAPIQSKYIINIHTCVHMCMYISRLCMYACT